ncbi:MAG: carboxypeptidase-like regulatory domain-containing protein [Bacteroidaceae bacterium]|nr:carboxypeptidase-like regulatory domain-containing protein [Bacteroidaceae bacterium]
MSLRIIAALLSLFAIAVQAQTTVKGHVVNERGDDVEYVSIGIEEDSVGVISDAQGHFTLTIPAGRKDDLTFTHVSYQTVIIPYTTYANGHELTVTLKDKVIELAEVVVGKKNKSHTLSGKSWIRAGSAGFEGDCKGEIEWGPIFKSKKDYLLTDIMLAINKCEYEECLLSFNCYEVRDKKFVNVLNKPIYKRVTPADNGQQFSVSPAESVVLKGKKKYCVTISVVDIKGKGRLAFPANFKSSYARHKVKGKMKKFPVCPMIIVKGYDVE